MRKVGGAPIAVVRTGLYAFALRLILCYACDHEQQPLQVPYGVVEFKSFQREGYCYIDKTCCIHAAKIAEERK